MTKLLMKVAIKATLSIRDDEEDKYLADMKELLEELDPYELAKYKRRAKLIWDMIDRITKK